MIALFLLLVIAAIVLGRIRRAGRHAFHGRLG